MEKLNRHHTRNNYEYVQRLVQLQETKESIKKYLFLFRCVITKPFLRALIAARFITTAVHKQKGEIILAKLGKRISLLTTY